MSLPRSVWRTSKESTLKPLRRVAVGLLLTSALCSHAGIDFEPCVLTVPDGRSEISAECGTSQVPLDPGSPHGERIELFVARISALSGTPEPDPFMVIAGGPGQASTTFYAQAGSVFSRIRRTREIVLIDQRGTGSSTPLPCENIENEDALLASDAFVRLGAECIDELSHDPAYFTTSVAVADLERVRETLGYPSLNIYGVSYGTRVAQHYLKRHPERVRSVILDGVVPPGLALGPGVAIDAQRALDSLLARCAASPACRDAYPELNDQLGNLLTRLRASPSTITIPHPRSGASTTLTLTDEMVAGIVRLLTYSPQTAALIPLLVRAAAEGDYGPLAAQVLMVSEEVYDALSLGMHFAVVCTEDVPFWGEVNRAALEETYLGSVQVDALGEICKSWPRGLIDEDFARPLKTDVPVILLSGEDDPVTPPSYAEKSLEGLTNHRHVSLTHQAHGQLATGCVPRLMGAFVKGADPEAFDDPCLKAVDGFPIFTTPMGPSP